MTKQTALKAIDSQISNVIHKTDGKLRYSRKDVTETLQNIRQMVSDIDITAFTGGGCIDKNESDIMQAVCSVTGLSKETITGPRRDAEVIRARKLFSVFAKQILGFKPDKIGRIINKDRTTVIFHIKNHEGDMFSCKPYRNAYNKACQLLGMNELTNK